MKFKKILMIEYSKGDLGTKQEKRLSKLGQEIIMLSKDNKDISRHLSTSDSLLVKLGASVDKSMIDKAPNLKYIGILGTGYGRIDTEYAAKRKITVCNIAGYSTEGVAELAFGLLIENIRELERAKVQARKGDYSEASFQGFELKNKKFGIIGLGRIGGRIAEIAKNGFGADVSYWSKNRKKEYEKKGIGYKTIEALVGESDFLSLNLAFTSQTKHFLNKQKISQIKSGAVIINLAPMELVDISALIDRLKKRDITFILDHSDELLEEDARNLSQYKNCVMYPPIGYITREATQAKLSMFVDNLENFLKGKPTNKVN
ncbi:MAG: 2-hydroxyacid dehydrogenase [Patescibacteria group bacterium]